MELMPERIAWYIAGPLVGLLLVALYATISRPIGVSGSFHSLTAIARGLPNVEMWRVWFFGGLIVGSLMFSFLRGGPSFNVGYGSLGQLLPIGVLIPILFVAGILIGFGARWAGGCTSGHGISGTAVLSPGSIAATMTFMATAVAITFALNLVTGGAL
jgi:uncharacterized protein